MDFRYNIGHLSRCPDICMPNALSDVDVPLVIHSVVDFRRNLYDFVIKPCSEASVNLGNRIHDARWLYGLYGALDGLSSSFSMLRYFFDVYYANSNLSSSAVSDRLHDWMLSPIGLVFVSIEVGVFFVVSVIANQCTTPKHLTDEQRHQLWPVMKKAIIDEWPYVRDGMKALKNVYKGLRNAFAFVNLTRLVFDAGYMMMPMGVGLGLLSAYNRPWLRKLKAERSNREKLNISQHQAHLKAIQQWRTEHLTDRQYSCAGMHAMWDSFQASMNAASQSNLELFQQQSQSDCFFYFALIAAWLGLSQGSCYETFWLYIDASVAFNAIVDAPYLFLGLAGLTVATPAVWILSVIAACAFLCVVVRLYEERNQQRELLVTQLDVQSALILRNFMGSLDIFSMVSAQLQASDCTEQDKVELLAIQQSILEQLNEQALVAARCRDALRKHSILSYKAIFLSGLKNGVESFGVVASLMFAVSSILVMTATPYPPFLLAAFITLGLGCLAFFIADALLGHTEHLYESAQNENPVEGVNLERLSAQNSTNSGATQGAIDATRTEMISMMKISRSRPYFYQPWFEVPRLFCSGIGKGIRIVDSLLVSWQVIGMDGHYHDTDSMMLIGQLSAVITSIVFALRGLANASNKSNKEQKKFGKEEELTGSARLGAPSPGIGYNSHYLFPSPESNYALSAKYGVERFSSTTPPLPEEFDGSPRSDGSIFDFESPNLNGAPV